MREKEDNWQRIESIIKWANMSTNYFARYIGLPRGENLYQIKRGNNGISRDVADRIVEKFPEVDKLWLLTGEGQMFVTPELRGLQIPYFNIDVEQGILSRERLIPESRMLIPQLQTCDFAMRYDGHAMGALVPAGSVVLLRAIEKEMLIPGEEYVVVGRKIVTLRIVRTGVDDKHWRLVAGNKDDFDDMSLDINDVDMVYKVVAKLIINK